MNVVSHLFEGFDHLGSELAMHLLSAHLGSTIAERPDLFVFKTTPPSTFFLLQVSTSLPDGSLSPFAFSPARDGFAFNVLAQGALWLPTLVATSSLLFPCGAILAAFLTPLSTARFPLAVP